MKKAIAALTLAASVASMGAFAKDWKEIRIGVEGAYPPFSETKPDGSIVGFDIDIAMALCEEMKAKCTLVKQDWDGMIPSLQAKKFDAIIASMSINEERKQKVDFSKKYYNTPQRMVVKNNSKIKDAKAEHLKDVKIGVQRGTIADQFVSKFWEPKGARVVRYAKQDEVYMDLKAGRVDAAFQDSVEASEGFLKKPEGKDFKFVGEAMFGKTPEEKAILGEGAGVAVRKEDKDLRDAFNKAIDAIRKNGKYQKINNKYFKFDVYGG